MEDSKNKKHDAIHKTLFQTLFPFAIQAMYPTLHELLDYENIHFLKEEFQLPNSSSYFQIDRRFVDILAEVPLKAPMKKNFTIHLGADQKLAVDPNYLREKFKDLFKSETPKSETPKSETPKSETTKSKTPKRNKTAEKEILITEEFEEGDIRSKRILIHIELERTSDLVEMSKRMREYFSIVSQEFSWTTVIPFVVFFHNGHESGLRWVTLNHTPYDKKINEFSFLSWGLNKDDPLYWLDQNNPLAIPLTAFMNRKKLDPVELKYRSYVSVFENPHLNDSQKANALDHIQAYQELNPMNQRIFNERIFKYQTEADLEMSPTQKLVVEGIAQGKIEGEVKGKIEGKMSAKQEVVLKYLHKYYQPTTQHQQIVQSIQDEKVLDSLLDDVIEHQKSLDQIFSIILAK